MRAAERRAFVSSLEDLGADAPTLCEPWRADDLASHIVVSEQYGGVAWAAAWPLRRVVGPAAATASIRRLQPVMLRMMARAQRRGWTSLLDRLSSGPPPLLRAGTLSTVRLLEEWIHHEDLRRANGLGPRQSDTALDAALTAGIEILAALPEFAAARRQIAVRLPDGRVIDARGTTAATVAGRPGEVVLALAGRGGVAEVDVDGDRSLLAPEALAF